MKTDDSSPDDLKLKHFLKSNLSSVPPDSTRSLELLRERLEKSNRKGSIFSILRWTPVAGLFLLVAFLSTQIYSPEPSAIDENVVLNEFVVQSLADMEDAPEIEAEELAFLEIPID